MKSYLGDLIIVVLMLMAVGGIVTMMVTSSNTEERATTDAKTCELRKGKYIVTYKHRSNFCLDKKYTIDLTPRGMRND